MKELNAIKQIDLFANNQFYKTLLQFVMLFNLFEDKHFDCKSGERKKLERFSKELNKSRAIKEETIKELLDFFHKRYVKNKNTYILFQTLFKKNENFGKESETLLRYIGEIDDYEKQLFLCLRIAYRFRNNLYHGNKKLLTLNNYEDCFKTINNSLFEVLEQLDDYKKHH